MPGDRNRLWVAARVSCYSGSRSNERPVSFRLEDRDFPVLDVLESWYEPDYLYFKVRTSDNCIYLLRVCEDEDRWEAKPWAVPTAGTSRGDGIDEPTGVKVLPFQEADSDGEQS
jgi:hypothetical protein